MITASSSEGGIRVKPRLYTYDWLERNGRLGNQLFQVGATIAKSQDDPGSYVSIKADWEYRPFFSVPDIFFTQFNRHPFEVVDGGTEYFQELEHFGNQAHYVKQILFPNDEAIDAMWSHPAYTEFVDFFERNTAPVCSIHVRRGDYLLTPQHFPVPSQQYYRTAIQKVLEEDPTTHFWVFSDDIDWCRRAFGGNKPQMHYINGTIRPVEVADRKKAGPPKDWMDLVAMVFCHRHIMANSTFSWWGSWLSGDERVIYPSKWFGPHPAVRDIPWRKMIPESWIEVEA